MTYSGLPIEGATVSFTYPSDLVLKFSGTNSESKTCMENGKWEPDPQNLECISCNYISHQATALPLLYIGLIFNLIFKLHI